MSSTAGRTEITCIDCGLPSFPGLPPFISVRRLIDGEIKRGILRHETCPTNAEEIQEQIAKVREGRAEQLRLSRTKEGLLSRARKLEHSR